MVDWVVVNLFDDTFRRFIGEEHTLQYLDELLESEGKEFLEDYIIVYAPKTDKEFICEGVKFI